MKNGEILEVGCNGGAAWLHIRLQIIAFLRFDGQLLIYRSIRPAAIASHNDHATFYAKDAKKLLNNILRCCSHTWLDEFV